jgi:hypothetical protein
MQSDSDGGIENLSIFITVGLSSPIFSHILMNTDLRSGLLLSVLGAIVDRTMLSRGVNA